MIETLAFDFGQVIGFFDHGRAMEKLTPFTDMSKQDMLAAIFGTELEDQFESARISEREFVCQLRELCRLQCDDATITGSVADIFWPNEELCALIPQLAKRYHLVLGSNTNAIHARHFQRMFASTLRHFDALIMSHEIGARKPKAAFFQHIIRVAQCSPERCLFIDDLHANVAGAKACGLRGTVYTSVEKLLEQLDGVRVKKQ